MSMAFFSMIGMWEVVAILAVVLVLFGAKKLPELARGLGTGIKEFRKATREVNEDLQRVFDGEEPSPPPRRLPPQDKSQNNAPPQSTSEPES